MSQQSLRFNDESNSFRCLRYTVCIIRAITADFPARLSMKIIWCDKWYETNKSVRKCMRVKDANCTANLGAIGRTFKYSVHVIVISIDKYSRCLCSKRRILQLLALVLVALLRRSESIPGNSFLCLRQFTKMSLCLIPDSSPVLTKLGHNPNESLLTADG